MSDIEKFPLSSLNITETQLEKLKQCFPEVFTEDSKIDWDKLKITLGETIDTGKERYGMNWPGKADCFKAIQQPSNATLIPDKDESVNFDSTENLFIEGDNLEVLKLLQKSYLGKIKMIYIDPPYNTGNDFIYPDNYSESLETYLEYTGQVDSEGRKFSTNTDTEGRFHSKWMNMMYPRLFLAKNLLREDGVIFISIDDNEVKNLRALCDEIFGEENFVEQICWKNKFGAGAKTKGFISVHEYILCYSKSPIINLEAPLDEEAIKKYSNVDEKFETRGGFVTQPLMTTSLDERKNLQYSIKYNGKDIKPDKQWVWEKERLVKSIDNNEVIIKEMDNGKFSVRVKQYLKDEFGNIRKGKPLSLIQGPYNQEGTAEVKNLLEGSFFDFPKPHNLIKYFFSFVINENEDKNGIYLDLFAGSCTTAHAVLELNKQDGGNRKFICVQLPEPTDENSEAFKAGYKTIADIGKERIRRVIQKLEAAPNTPSLFKEGATGVVGFKVFKLAKSNFSRWNADVEKTPAAIQEQLFKHVQHISPEAEQEAILYELLLKSGFELTTPLKKISLPTGEGHREGLAYSIAENELIICLEKNLTHDFIKAIAELKPQRIICLDEGFQNNDQLKTNAALIMKSKGVVKFQTV